MRGLGSIGTAILGVGGLATVLTSLHSLLEAAVLGVLTTVVLLLVTRKDRFGASVLQRGSERMAWSQSKWRGWTVFRSGPLGVIGSGACELPGLGSQIEAFEAVDSKKHRFGVLHHKGTKHVTTVLRCFPHGLGMTDQDDMDQQVAYYGELLRVMGAEAGLLGGSVTVEASPDPGTRLRNEVRGHEAAQAPELTKRVMHSLADGTEGVSRTICWVTLTWAAKSLAGRERAVDEVVLEIAARLPGLRDLVTRTGLGACRSLTVDEVAGVVRSAYDPDVAGAISDSPGSVDWENCGPLEAEEHVGFYEHDGWTSSTWEMVAAPRGQVRETVLRSLLRPHSSAPIKRVTMLYRPYEVGEAAKRVDNDVMVTHTNLTSRRGLTKARESRKFEAAKLAQQEEATGAGLVRFGLLVTISQPGDMTDQSQRELDAVIDSLGDTARIVLRKPKYAQAGAFLAALPVGLVLPAHSYVSQRIRAMS